MTKPREEADPSAKQQAGAVGVPAGYRRTLAGSVEFEGKGIHTGEHCRVRVHPGREGLVLWANGVSAPVSAEHAVELERRSALQVGETRINTCEHLLSALFGLEIDSAVVEVDGPEVPILDGSALPFVEAFEEVGIQCLDEPRRLYQPARPVWVSEGNAVLAALPPSGLHGLALTVRFVLTGSHPTLSGQSACYIHNPGAFRQEIAPARTWCIREQVEQLLAGGLALGGDLDNTLVVDERGYSSALRVPDEPVRHKVLDLLGDIALLGVPLAADLVAVGSGHRLNIRLVRSLLASGLASAD